MRYGTTCVLTAAAACVFSGCVSTAPGPGEHDPLVFLVMADPQFGMTADDEDFEKETELFEKAVRAANRLKPAFVVVCGDLVNKPGDEAQINELLRIAAKLDPSIALHWVAGNHDIGNEPTPESLALYRERFGEDWYTFEVRGCTFAVLNSTIIHCPDKVDGEVARQWEWLRAALPHGRRTPGRHTIVFQHHPLFITAPDEEDQYFNIPCERRARYLRLFKERGVTAVFSGHYHRNSSGSDEGMAMITSGPVGKPLGEDPSGFTRVMLFGERMEADYRTLEGDPVAPGVSPGRASSPR